MTNNVGETCEFRGKVFSIGEEVRIFTGGLHIPTEADFRGTILSFIGNDSANVSTTDGVLEIYLSRLHKMEEGELSGYAKPTANA